MKIIEIVKKVRRQRRLGKLTEYNLYKIGITTRTIKERYRYEGGQVCSTIFKHKKYVGPKVFLKTGNTEVFAEDIFNGVYE